MLRTTDVAILTDNIKHVDYFGLVVAASARVGQANLPP